MSRVKSLVLTAALIAVGVILPMAFHAIPKGGNIFLPMHIPVLLCGFICGPLLGLFAGVITPVISAFATGMPPMTVLPGMAVFTGRVHIQCIPILMLTMQKTALQTVMK